MLIRELVDCPGITMNRTNYLSCDICQADNPQFLLEPPGLDGPLVQCLSCGFRYVGTRRAGLTFGTEKPEETAGKVRAANVNFRHLRLEEEHRLALLNARW